MVQPERKSKAKYLILQPQIMMEFNVTD